MGSEGLGRGWEGVVTRLRSELHVIVKEWCAPECVDKGQIFLKSVSLPTPLLVSRRILRCPDTEIKERETGVDGSTSLISWSTVLVTNTHFLVP